MTWPSSTTTSPGPSTAPNGVSWMKIVRYEELRQYLVAFADSAYQNPKSICPQHHMMLPRMIRAQIVKGLERPKKES